MRTRGGNTLWQEMMNITRREGTHETMSMLIIREVETYDDAKREQIEDFFLLVGGYRLSVLLGLANGELLEDAEKLTFKEAVYRYELARRARRVAA